MRGEDCNLLVISLSVQHISLNFTNHHFGFPSSWNLSENTIHFTWRAGLIAYSRC